MVGIGLPTPPPLLISPTSSSPSPSGIVTSISAASRPPSLSRTRAAASVPASTNETSKCSEASAIPSARVKTSLKEASSSTNKMRFSTPIPPRNRSLSRRLEDSTRARCATDGFSYSPKCVEGEFCELRAYLLGSWLRSSEEKQHGGNPQQVDKGDRKAHQ